jgi:hypothetical protein
LPIEINIACNWRNIDWQFTLTIYREFAVNRYTDYCNELGVGAMENLHTQFGYSDRVMFRLYLVRYVIKTKLCGIKFASPMAVVTIIETHTSQHHGKIQSSNRETEFMRHLYGQCNTHRLLSNLLLKSREREREGRIIDCMMGLRG